MRLVTMTNSTHDDPQPILGKPILVRGKAYYIKEKAILGNSYAIVCPLCNKHQSINPKKEGVNIERCPQCNAQIGYNAKSLTSTSSTDDAPSITDRIRVHKQADTHTTKGKLTWGFFGIHHACLAEGSNIIGRKDKEQPSDISIDDNYMSRRSISIDVEKRSNASGFVFKLTVLKSANPVIVNSNQLHIGNSIYLNYGDTIRLGNTVFTFRQDKK